MAYPKMILKRGKGASLQRQHPWVFSGAIYTLEGTPEEGDWIEIDDGHGHTYGWGLYEAKGSIRARLVTFDSNLDEAGIWKDRISEAVGLRERIGLLDNPETNACRLVFGEGDRLPGLVIDRYGEVAVIQTHTWGMYRNREAIADALQQAMGGRISRIYLKAKEALPNEFRDQVEDGWLVGEGEPVTEILENGYRFNVFMAKGQKTGFFLDQRENRLELGRWCKDRSVLNLFSYSGGFSIYAAKGGAKEVVGVDSSAAAIEQANDHVKLNNLDPEIVHHEVSDVFDFMKSDDRKWDIIVCDPPAFAKAVKARHNALMAYKRLNAAAINKVNPGGVLFTFSCSQVVTSDLFLHTIRAAGVEAGRNIRILKTLHQPPDHPVNLFHPEGEYLKGLVLEVE